MSSSRTYGSRDTMKNWKRSVRRVGRAVPRARKSRSWKKSSCARQRSIGLAWVSAFLLSPPLAGSSLSEIDYPFFALSSVRLAKSIRGTGLDSPRKRCPVPHVGPTRSRLHPVAAFYSNIEFESGHGNSVEAGKASKPCSSAGCFDTNGCRGRSLITSVTSPI